MGYLKKYKEQYQIRLIKEVIISMIFATLFSKGNPLVLLFWFVGILLLLDLVLVRVDKIIKLGERN